MSMRNSCWIVIAGLLLIRPTWAAQTDAQPDVATLRRENAELKGRIDALERRVKLLQQAVEKMQPKPGEIRILPTPAEPYAPMPQNELKLTKPELQVIPAPKLKNEHPDWKEGRFNGVRFYLIPISDEGANQK